MTGHNSNGQVMDIFNKYPRLSDLEAQQSARFRPLSMPILTRVQDMTTRRQPTDRSMTPSP